MLPPEFTTRLQYHEPTELFKTYLFTVINVISVQVIGKKNQIKYNCRESDRNIKITIAPSVGD